MNLAQFSFQFSQKGRPLLPQLIFGFSFISTSQAVRKNIISIIIMYERRTEVSYRNFRLSHFDSVSRQNRFCFLRRQSSAVRLNVNRRSCTVSPSPGRHELLKDGATGCVV